MGSKSKEQEQDWTKILGWPGYRVYHYEINEKAKTLKLWVRRKSGNRKLVCSGCGRRVQAIHEIYEREIRDLPWSQFRTTPGRRWHPILKEAKAEYAKLQ